MLRGCLVVAQQMVFMVEVSKKMSTVSDIYQENVQPILLCYYTQLVSQLIGSMKQILLL